MVVGGAAMALLATACGPPPDQPDPSTLRSEVARHALEALNAWGMPVESDHVGCHGPDATDTVVCEAVTTDVPTGSVSISFTPDQPSSVCSGTLVVTMNGSPLTQGPIDPCR
jgi:hypothetical protein